MAFEEGKLSKTNIANELGVPQNTLSTWLKKSAEIKQLRLWATEEMKPIGKISRSWGSGFKMVRTPVMKMSPFQGNFGPQRKGKISRSRGSGSKMVSGPFLMHKANSFARELGVPENKFQCSNGWLECFKERHGITFKKVCGESKSINLMLDKMKEWNERLSSILAEYSTDNIFNAD